MSAYRKGQTVVKRVAELHVLPEHVRLALVTEEGRYNGLWERGESETWHYPPVADSIVAQWISFPSTVLSGAKIR